MIPSLFTYTLLTAFVFLGFGLFLALQPERGIAVLKAFPRHRLTGIITMVIGGGWFVWKLSQLGQSDFGDYKNLLMILFGATVVGSILYVRDFLAVRGVAIIVLLAANTGLKSAFGLYDIPERLVLVVILYVFIIAGLTYGIMPYHMRETVNWFTKSTDLVRRGGLVFSSLGGLLLVCAVLY